LLFGVGILLSKEFEKLTISDITMDNLLVELGEPQALIDA